jgi:hypothetical protein
LINAGEKLEKIYEQMLIDAIDKKNIDAVMSLLRDPERWHNMPQPLLIEALRLAAK